MGIELGFGSLTALTIGLLLFFLFSGAPIAAGLGLVGFVLVYVFAPAGVAEGIAAVSWASVNSFTIMAIPLFILMGNIFSESGLARIVYAGVSPLMQRYFPGGLLQTNILTGALFAACSGSSIATTSAIGIVSIPEMEARGYERRLAIGSVTGAGALGILIPPSIGMIVYGEITGQSVGKLFIGGIIPGLILACIYMIYIAIALKMNPQLGPPREKQMSARECWLKSLSAWPVVIIAVSVIGSIYAGVATPTEAAAVGAFFALVLSAGYGLLTWEKLNKVTWSAMRVTAMILILFVSTKVMQLGIAVLQIPQDIVSWAVAIGLGKWAILVLIYVLYMILGMIMEFLAAMLMTLPITYPVLMAAGFDPIWAGVIVTVLGECALLTPPVGMALFVVQGLRPDFKFGDIVGGTMPFFGCIMLLLVILTIFPQLVTWLPTVMGHV
jgi:C4-dicarboxylate transporter, DctM subunit